MQFSLAQRTASLSVGEFSDFALGPRESGGGAAGLWRAQLGQHWHNELRTRTLAEAPAAQFEIPIEGRPVHRGRPPPLARPTHPLLGPTPRNRHPVPHPPPPGEDRGEPSPARACAPASCRGRDFYARGA